MGFLGLDLRRRPGEVLRKHLPEDHLRFGSIFIA
jgi:hypothetical protein